MEYKFQVPNNKFQTKVNMKISVELTCTPLQNDYEPPIKAFIKKMRESGLVVLENQNSSNLRKY